MGEMYNQIKQSELAHMQTREAVGVLAVSGEAEDDAQSGLP